LIKFPNLPLVGSAFSQKLLRSNVCADWFCSEFYHHPAQIYHPSFVQKSSTVSQCWLLAEEREFPDCLEKQQRRIV